MSGYEEEEDPRDVFARFGEPADPGSFTRLRRKRPEHPKRPVTCPVCKGLNRLTQEERKHGQVCLECQARLDGRSGD